MILPWPCTKLQWATPRSQSSQGDPPRARLPCPPWAFSILPVSPTCWPAGVSSTQRHPCLQVSVWWLTQDPEPGVPPRWRGEGTYLAKGCQAPLPASPRTPGVPSTEWVLLKPAFPGDGREGGPSPLCPHRFPRLPGPAGGLAAHPAAAAGLPPARPLHRLQVSAVPLPAACRHSRPVTGPILPLSRQRAGAEVLPADPGGARDTHHGLRRQPLRLAPA